MLGSIFDLLGGLFNFDFSAITENIVTLLLTVLTGIIGIFSISYLGRRRKTLDHERMAVILKGLKYAGVATRDIIKKPSPDSHEQLMKGMRWLFGALGISGALYTYGSVEPVVDAGDAVRGALIGIVPGAIGIAHLVCAWFCKRKERQQTAMYNGGVYRAAARRY